MKIQVTNEQAAAIKKLLADYTIEQFNNGCHSQLNADELMTIDLGCMGDIADESEKLFNQIFSI